MTLIRLTKYGPALLAACTASVVCVAPHLKDVVAVLPHLQGRAQPQRPQAHGLLGKLAQYIVLVSAVVVVEIVVDQHVIDVALLQEAGVVGR